MHSIRHHYLNNILQEWMNCNKCLWIRLSPINTSIFPLVSWFSPIFARGTGDQTSDANFHGKSENLSWKIPSKRVGCSIAMLVYRGVGIFGISSKAEKHFKMECEISCPTTAFTFQASRGPTSLPSRSKRCMRSLFEQQQFTEHCERYQATFLLKKSPLSWIMYGTPPIRSPGDCASLQLLKTLESLTFIPFLGTESATRQQMATENDMTSRHQE